MGCEKEQLFPVADQSAVRAKESCLYADCVLAQNPYVKRHGEKNLSLQVEELQSQLSSSQAQSDLALIANHYGEPVWSLAVEKEIPNSDASHIYLPFITATSDRVEAIVMAVYDPENDNYRLQFINRDRITRFPKKEKTNELQSRLSREMVGLIFTQVETQLFGSPQCDLVAILNQIDPLAKDCYWKYVETTTCYHYEAGGYHGADCVTDYNWEFVGCSGGITTGGFISGGGGGWTGGTGNDGNSDPDRDPCLEDGRDCPEEEEEDVIVIISPQDNINNNIDPEEYPCATNAVTLFSESLGTGIGAAIQAIFSGSEYVNINISASDLGESGGAYTLPSVRGVFGGSYFTFDANVTLNSNGTRLTCTSDYILKSIIHESLHAYIAYQKAILPEEEFNNLFPLFAGGSSADDSAHIVMANQYVAEISNLLRSYNPNITDEAAIALAWSGLSETEAWGKLPLAQQQLYTSIIEAARCKPGSNDINNYKLIPCS